ncbi:MAG: DUF255 domain-containing protein [Luteolibacter sp.]|uniref:DUF255 domain-containing protein n=1 Tax=Luteolibacter sp. TaxID=1962973 RepID=UPI003266BC6A
MLPWIGMSCAVAFAGEGIAWRNFDAATFPDAQAGKKLVFLDLEAVWCHWCHVMDAKTYSDPEVRAALRDGFISVKIDSDSRPDLARRYEDYGWPALVVLDPVTMKERAIASGFQTKKEFLDFLADANGQQGINLPSSGKASTDGVLTAEQKAKLLDKLRNHYDKSAKGWGTDSKFVPWGNIEYCIRFDQEGYATTRKMAEDTLTAGTGLIDPEWGGVYQYSTDGDWVHPHFEKIMEYQTEIARAYALSYQAWKRPADMVAAEKVAGYLNDFLRSPEGAYYTSQDADVVRGEHSAEYFGKSDKERRAIGMPRVDNHIYSRENGMAINTLVTLYQTTAKTSYLENAEKAAQWIIANRSLAGGGFSHDAKDSHGPFLADQVYMGRAMLAIYQATADRQWLDRSAACANFAIGKFKREESRGAGFLAGVAFDDAPPPVTDRDENIQTARWLNLLGKTTGDEQFATAAKHAMRYLATDEVADSIYSFTGGLLLADEELAGEPIHIAIVGKRNDPAARFLFEAAQKHPSSYKVIEWVAGGGDSIYPEIGKAAAFFCTARSCSTPKFEAQELLDSFAKR